MLVELPYLPLRNIVLFPGTARKIDVGREQSKRAIALSERYDRKLLLLTQLREGDHDPQLTDLYDTGLIVRVRQVVTMPDNTLQVLVEGLERAKLLPDAASRQTSSVVVVRQYDEFYQSEPSSERPLLIHKIKESFQRFSRTNSSIQLDEEQKRRIALGDGADLADVIAHVSSWVVKEKQQVLGQWDIDERLKSVLAFLTRDLEQIDLERAIANRVKEQMDANQREYYLREQLKAIGKELGGDDDPENKEELRRKIIDAGMPKVVLEKALKELKRLEHTPTSSPEAAVLRSYIECLIDLPWHKKDKEILDIVRTRDVLDADHFALDDVKERILEFLAVRQLLEQQGRYQSTSQDNNKEQDVLQAPVLVLAGPPGVGKTSLGKSIARSLNRQFVRVALGGVHDESEIRGHRRTYVASLPGRIIHAMKTAGVVNPVILLDEIDKMGSDRRGDPSSALLEVLDPEQNHAFQDHYLELPYDLSQVMFITTANSLQSISRPLLDRMEVINIAGYTQTEKLEIAQRYRVPRQLKAHGLSGKLSLSEAAIRRMIEEYTSESGVRQLDRQISKVARKSARQLLESPWAGVRVIEPADLDEYLGVPTELPDRMEKEPQVGVAQGLAWTSVGGAMLLVEALATAGTGKISMTGSLGDVMKESVGAAVAYLRAHAHRYGADVDFYKNIDIHVHFPDGATPKDGPSAGITVAAAVISAITGRPLRSDVAMTGEISLRGRVLPIGGVKEKLLAAHQGGIREVILPKDNEANLRDVPETIKGELNIHLFQHVSEVLDLLLMPASKESMFV